MKRILWESGTEGTAFFLGKEKIGLACAMEGATDRFVPVEDGVICWERHVQEATDEMEMRFITEGKSVYTMIPAVQYDGNRCVIQDYFEVRKQSPLFKEEKEETYEQTYFAADRDARTGEIHRISYKYASIPGATYSEREKTAFALFLPLGCEEGACSLYEQDGHMVHAVLWPEQSGPAAVMHGGKWIKNFRVPGEKRTCFKAMMVFSHVERPRTAWRDLLNAAWRQNYTLWTPERTQEELWALGISYAKALYTQEDDGFCGFSIGYTWQDGAWVKRDVQKYEIGWCGQNASLAVSLLTHARSTGDAQAARMALNVLDSWVRAAGAYGIIPTHYDENMYTNGFEKTVDACNLGTAAVQLFQAAECASALGVPRPTYTQAAEAICEFALRVMKDSGLIGKSWLEKDLSPAVEEGTTGAFLTWALCEYAKRKREARVMEAAERSLSYYAHELGEKGYTTAGALDIFTIDKESCIPLLKSALALYELTGKEEYIRMAEDAAYYLSTWQWHYTRTFPPESLFAQMHFNLFGGTAVSIHGGMDPYALFYVNDLLRLGEITGNPIWAQRAGAAWRHGQQYISDGTYVLDGKAPRPRGSQDESVGTAYGVHENAPSQWLVAWPTAFRLEILRAWMDESGKHFTRVL